MQGLSVKNTKIACINRPGMIRKPIHESIEHLVAQIEHKRSLTLLANAVGHVAGTRVAGFIHLSKYVEGVLQIGINYSNVSSGGKREASRHSGLMAEVSR